MATAVRLEQLGWAFGADRDHGFTAWTLATPDPLAAVLAPGYFRHCSTRFRPGDLVFCASGQPRAGRACRQRRAGAASLPAPGDGRGCRRGRGAGGARLGLARGGARCCEPGRAGRPERGHAARQGRRGADRTADATRGQAQDGARRARRCRPGPAVAETEGHGGGRSGRGGVGRHARECYHDRAAGGAAAAAQAAGGAGPGGETDGAGAGAGGEAGGAARGAGAGPGRGGHERAGQGATTAAPGSR